MTKNILSVEDWLYPLPASESIRTLNGFQVFCLPNLSKEGRIGIIIILEQTRLSI